MRPVDTGEWLTRGTVWLALLLYVAAEVAATRRDLRGFKGARWLNTAGLVVFLGHIASAFQHYHQWSHTVAYAETAEQTKEFVGWNWGGGLYLNYLFTLIWLGDVVAGRR